MTLEQVEMLERTFAYLTKEGWVTPHWVLSLKRKILTKEITCQSQTKWASA